MSILPGRAVPGPAVAALPRLLASGFLADFQLYLIYTALPFKALRLGAGPFELGALAAISTGSYALLVGYFGKTSDRLPRTQMARFSCLGILLCCIGMTAAPDIPWLFLAAPFAGGSMSPFWPSVQAGVADLSPPSRLERNLGRFNLAWTLGKASGFLVGGTVVARWGDAATFTLASCVAFTNFFVLPALPRTSAAPAAKLRGESETGGHAGAEGDVGSEDMAAGYRRPAWVANGVAYGVGATLNHHYPRLVREFGWSAHTFGLFLGLVYLTQAVTFVALTLRPQRWRFRRAPLYVPQLLMLVAVVTLPLADRGRVLLSALVFGFALGSCYSASIYYSLHAAARRGRNAGIHERAIGIGSMGVPFLGGWLAREQGGLWVPYAVAGAIVAVGLVVQEGLHRQPRGGMSGMAREGAQAPGA